MEEKTKKKTWQKILLVILVILAIYLIFFIYNYQIVNKIAHGKQEYLQSTNYHVKIKNTDIIDDIYYKDGILIQKISRADTPDYISIITWTDFNNDETLMLWPESNIMKKVKASEEIPLTTYKLQPAFLEVSTLDKVQISATSWISSEGDCYKITAINGNCYLIDKNTLLPKEKNGIIPIMNADYLASDVNPNVQYEITEFGTVSDEDVAKPDTTNYTMQEENNE